MNRVAGLILRQAQDEALMLSLSKHEGLVLEQGALG
jgi:hypothetical protein